MTDDTIKPRLGERLARNVGVGTIVSIAVVMLVYYHNVTISEEARLAVKEHTSSVDRQIEAAALSLKLTEIANQLHNEDAYTKMQRDSALDLILNEVPRYTEFMESSAFLVTLERVVIALAAAHLTDDVARIDEKHRSMMIVSDKLIVAVTQLFGMSLLSSPDAPSGWSTHSRLKDYLETYEAYSIRCKEGGFPEDYLLLQMLMEDVRGRYELVGAFVQDVAELNEEDAGIFAKKFSLYLTGDFTTDLSGDKVRFVCRARDFYARHNESLKEAAPEVAGLVEENLDYPLRPIPCMS